MNKYYTRLFQTLPELAEYATRTQDEIIHIEHKATHLYEAVFKRELV